MAPKFLAAVFLHAKAWFSPPAALPAPSAPLPPPLISAPAHRARLLPAWLYALADMGHHTLDALANQPIMLHTGITRFMFLDDKINAMALDPFIATHCPTGLSAQCHHIHHRVFTVPGFCYACLFDDEWFFLAIATLGPYPLAANVACLSIYFSWAASQGIFALSSSSVTRHGHYVSHVKGHAFTCRSKIMIYDPVPRLRSMGAMVVGAAPGDWYFPHHDFPPLPPSQPHTSGANSMQLGNHRLPSNYATPEYAHPMLPPPHTRLPPRPMGPPPPLAGPGPSHGPSLIYNGMAIPVQPPAYSPQAPICPPVPSRGHGGPTRGIPRGVSHVFNPRSKAPPHPKCCAPSPAPYQPFHPYPSVSCLRQSSPWAAPVAWKSAM